LHRDEKKRLTYKGAGNQVLTEAPARALDRRRNGGEPRPGCEAEREEGEVTANNGTRGVRHERARGGDRERATRRWGGRVRGGYRNKGGAAEALAPTGWGGWGRRARRDPEGPRRDEGEELGFGWARQ